MTYTLSLKADGMPQIISDAMAGVADRDIPIEDRAALYAVLHQVQLRINRALKLAKDDLIVHLESNGLRDFGPLSIKATAIDVAWPANSPENHADATIQEAMETYAAIAPDYFTHVPDHWELRTAALGAGVAAGDPVAMRLHREAKEHGWRTEEGRRLSLAVKEVRHG